MVDAHSHSQATLPFEWIKTEDGSMTLKPKSEGSEWMHSLKGAYSESQYIYGRAIREIIAGWPKSKPLYVFSLGLGLGYVEWIAVLECLKADIPFCIHTYESEESLKRFFIDQLNLPETESFSYLQEFLFKDYSEIEVKTALKFLKTQFTNKKPDSLGLQFYGSFSKESILEQNAKYNIIFYDAYSSKSQNQLWEVDFLKLFLQRLADLNHCALSSYACTGTLKKALKEEGFQILKTKGFAYKRESTWAVRGSGFNSGLKN